MAEYAVICVIRTIGEILLYEAKYLPELRGRIEVIQMKLRQLQSILEITDASQEADEGIRSWLAETREVAYDIEDLLLVAVSSRKEGSLIRKYTHVFKEVTNLHYLEPKFQVIEAKISALESDLRVRNIKPQQRGLPNPVSQRSIHQRRTYSHHFEEDSVGLDDEIADLLSHLFNKDGDKSYEVVSITGMGGIGKTTLAKKIYHHPDVQRYFHAFAWVCVSQQWKRKDVLQRILNKLEPHKKKEINKMKIEELVEELYEVQLTKRCLIVMDDVWQKDVWDIVRPSFPKRQMNSKVLLTTRNKEIAHYIDIHHSCYLYEQRHLNEHESWELLKKKVYHGLNFAGPSFDKFQGNDSHYADETEHYSDGEDADSVSSAESFHSCKTDEEGDEAIGHQLHTSSPEDSIQDHKNQIEIEKLGKAMVGQCGGLPLAIIVLGGLLMTKSTVGEWRTVHQNLNSYLRRGTSSEENERVHEVLALSYHDLPYHLKPCFLHLGNFPEDSKIPARKLYQLWAAEGFIPPQSYQAEEERSIMDTAEHYLGELMQRSMVQVRVEEVTGKYKSCRLHDLTRELCLLKGKEENFLKKVPLRYEPQLIDSPSLPKATSINITRRLSVVVECDFESYFPPKKENFDHIRSAMLFSRLSDRRNILLTLNWLCNYLKVLRVLDLERFDFGRKLSKDIGNLVHLKYLSLRGSQFYKLPSSIGNLKYLQTLDLRLPFLVCLTVPNVIWKLNNLRHLYLPPSHRCTTKLQLSNLNKLEILKNFDTRVSDYRDIPKLTNLQKLAAILTLQIDNLEALNNSLKMESNRIRESSFRIRYDFQSERELCLLKELVEYTHLRKLDLIGCISNLPEHFQFARSLTKLTLRSSKLKEDPMVTLEMMCNLYSLKLRKNVYEGNEIRCSAQGFPQLRILEFQGLTSLENLVIEEGAMRNLQSLCIDECINMKMVPEGIKYVVTLRELVIANMPDDFKHRVQKVHEESGEDIHKVEHIPTITITETSNLYMKQLEIQLSGKSNSGIFQTISPALVPKDW